MGPEEMVAPVEPVRMELTGLHLPHREFLAAMEERVAAARREVPELTGPR